MLHPVVWTEFVTLRRCLAADRREYPDWHRGRPRYYVWAIDAGASPVNDRLRGHRERLEPRLIAPYARQAHITLGVCGFLGQVVQYNDDVTPERIDDQARCVQALKLQPFTLHVGGANSFASAPFLEVADRGETLASLRQVLTGGDAEYRTSPYVAHVTIGIYSDDHATTEIARLLRDRDEEPIAVAVNAIGLYSYAATSIGSPLRLEREVPLIAVHG